MRIPQEAPNRFTKRKVIILLVTFILLSLIVYLYAQSPIAKNLQGVVQGVFSKPKEFIYSLRHSEEKESDIKKENKKLSEKLVNYELMKRENDALKSQFDISSDYSQGLVGAKIVGFLGERALPTAFVINAGEDQKIQKGMPVISDKYLVGKIEKVSKKYSVVITPLNPNFSTLAKLPETGAQGILVGSEEFMVFDRVVITDNLEEGGIIVTKGEVKENGIGILPDIIIGKIKSISKNETSPFQSAQVLPIINYSRLLTVFIITTP